MVSEPGPAASDRSIDDETTPDDTATDVQDEDHSRDGSPVPPSLRDRVEVTTLRAEVELLERERDALRERIGELEDEIADLEAEVAELESTVDSKDRSRQRIIDRYEDVIAERGRDDRSPDADRARRGTDDVRATARCRAFVAGVVRRLTPVSGD